MSRAPGLAGFLDDLIHPKKAPEAGHDPGKPFTPPPSEPSKDENDDEDGPRFPMDPAMA
jgi:hypothetical protein